MVEKLKQQFNLGSIVALVIALAGMVIQLGVYQAKISQNTKDLDAIKEWKERCVTNETSSSREMGQLVADMRNATVRLERIESMLNRMQDKKP